ncbi:helix-turn-helix domain-containing protein [Actinomadura logoneensis]|nr:helix-turn-helix transcriptional regulator [Actinomadura logoneensis]
MVQRAILVGELQRLRAATGEPPDRVAAALDWSTTKLVRIETGAVGVSTTDLRALLRHYGLTDGDERVAALTAMARDARERGWWSLYQRDLAPGYLRYIGYESGASVVSGFQMTTVPCLLQTEEYADAVTREHVESSTDREVLVEVRMRRQAELFARENPPRLDMIVDEAALRRHVGGPSDPGVMPRQLRHLLDMLDRPWLTLRVIPFAAGAHCGMMGGFLLLRFGDPRINGVLFEENSGGPVLTVGDRDSRVAAHRSAFEKLGRLALPPGRTSAYIAKITASMEANVRKAAATTGTPPRTRTPTR